MPSRTAIATTRCSCFFSPPLAAGAGRLGGGTCLPCLTMIAKSSSLPRPSSSRLPQPVRSSLRHRRLLHPDRGRRARRHRRARPSPLPDRLRRLAGRRQRRRHVHDRRHPHPAGPRSTSTERAGGGTTLATAVLHGALSGEANSNRHRSAPERRGGRRSSRTSSDHWKRLLRRPPREPVALDAQAFVDELNRHLRADQGGATTRASWSCGGDAGDAPRRRGKGPDSMKPVIARIVKSVVGEFEAEQPFLFDR